MGEVEEDVVHGGPVRVGDGQHQGGRGHLQRLLHLLGRQRSDAENLGDERRGRDGTHTAPSAKTFQETDFQRRHPHCPCLEEPGKSHLGGA